MERFGELDEIRQRGGVAFGVAAAIEQFLPLAHHAHILVVEDEDLDRQPVLAGGRHLLDVHQDRRLAGDVDDQGVGMGDLHPDRRRQAVAHGAQPARGHEALRLLQLVKLGGPHLVLPDFRGDVDVALLGVLVKALERELRLDDGVRHLVGKAVTALPGADLLPPLAQRLLVRAAFPFLPPLDDLPEDGPDIADDGQIDHHVLVDGCRIDVDLDLLRTGRELRQLARHPVVESRPHRDHQVAIVHRQVGFIGAVHAEHADEQGIGPGETAETHERIGAGKAGHPHQPRQQTRCRGTRVDDPAPGIEDRPLGAGDQTHGFFDLIGFALQFGPVGLVPGLARRRIDRLGL